MGIDEVGRGCWAGPVVAAAVVLDTPISGLNDSKLLNEARRQQLDNSIRATALAIGIGWVWPTQVDSDGLTAAVRSAMQQAYDQINVSHQEVIIDGSYNFLPHIPRTKAVIKADSSYPAVSAASIVAKVARDTYMKNIAAEFPLYGFDKHVGYGTKTHLEALNTYGPTIHHRMSYKPLQRFKV